MARFRKIYLFYFSAPNTNFRDGQQNPSQLVKAGHTTISQNLTSDH